MRNLFIIDIPSTELSEEDLYYLSHPLTAGVILFSRHFKNQTQLYQLIQDIRQKVKKPFLITVDQEGGRVQRFREGFTQLPAMQAFSALKEEKQLAWAKEAGWQMAMELLSLDIDLSFAPVLDVGFHCKAIGDRSFSENEEQVYALGRAFILGMNEAGMPATGKHFPGHGAVIEDSHLETPKDKRSKEEIFKKDIQPFARLIKEELLEAIMPAHVIYSQCDDKPASASSSWLQKILRQQLEFNGVIFSDDLGMKGADCLGNYLERSQKVFQAGCDLLLLCNNREAVKAVYSAFNLKETNTKRLQRIEMLYKKQSLDWQKLQNNARYQRNKIFLSELQQQWLSQQDNQKDPTENL